MNSIYACPCPYRCSGMGGHCIHICGCILILWRYACMYRIWVHIYIYIYIKYMLLKIHMTCADIDTHSNTHIGYKGHTCIYVQDADFTIVTHDTTTVIYTHVHLKLKNVPYFDILFDAACNVSSTSCYIGWHCNEVQRHSGRIWQNADGCGYTKPANTQGDNTCSIIMVPCIFEHHNFTNNVKKEVHPIFTEPPLKLDAVLAKLGTNS